MHLSSWLKQKWAGEHASVTTVSIVAKLACLKKKIYLCYLLFVISVICLCMDHESAKNFIYSITYCAHGEQVKRVVCLCRCEIHNQTLPWHTTNSVIETSYSHLRMLAFIYLLSYSNSEYSSRHMWSPHQRSTHSQMCWSKLQVIHFFTIQL